MPSRLLPEALLLALLALAPQVSALSTDIDQPIEIEADAGEFDESAGRTVYTGNVIVTQGSMRMTGDRLIANFDDNRVMIDAFLNGQPATFHQTPDGGKQDIDAIGNKIEYHPRKNLIFVIEKARLTQGERVFEGYRINYDTKRSIITGTGTAQNQGGGAPASKPGRVKVVIPPKKRAGPPASVSPAVPEGPRRVPAR